MLQEWDDALGICVKTASRKMLLGKVTAGSKVLGMLLHPALVYGKCICKLEQFFVVEITGTVIRAGVPRHDLYTLA